MALPFYAVLTSNDELIDTFHGYDTDIENFKNFLKTTLEKYKN